MCDGVANTTVVTISDQEVKFYVVNTDKQSETNSECVVILNISTLGMLLIQSN